MKIASSSAPRTRTLGRTLRLLAILPALLAAGPGSDAVAGAARLTPQTAHSRPRPHVTSPAHRTASTALASTSAVVPTVTQTVVSTAALHDAKGLSPAALSAALD